jgi:hypothetical protein
VKLGSGVQELQEAIPILIQWLKEWDGRPARLFCLIRYGRDARATLLPIPKIASINQSLEQEIVSSDFLSLQVFGVHKDL